MGIWAHPHKFNSLLETHMPPIKKKLKKEMPDMFCELISGFGPYCIEIQKYNSCIKYVDWNAVRKQTTHSKKCEEYVISTSKVSHTKMTSGMCT